MKIGSDFIKIKGIDWYKHKILDNGSPYVTFERAIEIADEMNMRLPTELDIEKLRYADSFILDKKVYLFDSKGCAITKSSDKKEFIPKSIKFDLDGALYNENEIFGKSVHDYFWIEQIKNYNYCASKKHYAYISREIRISQSFISDEPYKFSLKLIRK